MDRKLVRGNTDRCDCVRINHVPVVEPIHPSQEGRSARGVHYELPRAGEEDEQD